MVVLTGFVMCGCVCGGVLTVVWVFGNMCTCIYCALYYLCCAFCIVSFIYIYILTSLSLIV